MRNAVVILFPVLLLLLVAACQSEPARSPVSDPLLAQLYVRFMQAGNRLQGEALLYASDTSATTTPEEPFPEQVTFMQQPATRTPLSGQQQRYSGSMRQLDSIPTVATFSFPDPAGQLRTWSVPLPVIHNFAFQGTISLQQGGLLTLENDLLQADEQLILLFSRGAQETRTIVVQGPMRRTLIQLAPQTVANLTPGEYQVDIVRKRQWRADEFGRPVVKTAEFYGLPQTATVVE